MTRPNIRTYQDLLRIPNYQPSIDPVVRPLRRIVTRYYLESEYPCGLKGCHQPHKEGFLVELEDGGISNVGWKCGEGFGDKFAVEKKRYAEEELRPKAIAVVQEVIQKIRTMRTELAHLATETDRLSRLKSGLRSRLPNLYRDLGRRAHSSDARVTEQIERTEKEIQDLQALSPGANRERFRYREEVRGALPGLAVIATNVREEVVGRLTARADALLETHVAVLPTDKLLDWERWAMNFDEAVASARKLLAGGAALFGPEGLLLLPYLTTVPAEKAALSKLTLAQLLRGEDEEEEEPRATPATHPASQPAVLSKKQRDIQKRLEATLRAARERRR